MLRVIGHEFRLLFLLVVVCFISAKTECYLRALINHVQVNIVHFFSLPMFSPKMKMKVWERKKISLSLSTCAVKACHSQREEEEKRTLPQKNNDSRGPHDSGLYTGRNS